MSLWWANYAGGQSYSAYFPQEMPGLVLVAYSLRSGMNAPDRTAPQKKISVGAGFGPACA